MNESREQKALRLYLSLKVQSFAAQCWIEGCLGAYVNTQLPLLIIDDFEEWK
jgi:hypothetical protein